MTDILIDLKQERAELVKSMEATLTLIETEKRERTPDEETKYKDSESKRLKLLIEDPADRPILAALVRLVESGFEE